MLPRPTHLMATAISVTLVLAPFATALAGTGPAAKMPGKASPILPEMICGGEYGSGGTNITINKPVNIYKPITINKNVNIFKPTVINKSIDITKNIDITNNINNTKNINIYKPITINKNIDITKNIDNSKNINITKNIDNSKNIEINKSIDNRKYIDNSKYISINKKIVINKGGSADASAMASAMAVAVAAAAAVASASASASVQNSININIDNSSSSSANSSSYSNSSSYANANANANARAGTIVYAGGSYETVTVNNYGSFDKLDVSASATPKKCVYQEATVVKAIHAVCVSAEGREFAASHMLANTWIDAAYEGEVARCIAGSTLKVTIGQVVQSDQGMATTYGNGVVLMCGAREAVRHYKDGLLKCAPAVAVPDCTERTNLRLYGTGDMFFSYRTQVCTEIFQSVASSEGYSREEESRDLEIENLSLSGGVGGGY